MIRHSHGTVIVIWVDNVTKRSGEMLSLNKGLLCELIEIVTNMFHSFFVFFHRLSLTEHSSYHLIKALYY